MLMKPRALASLIREIGPRWMLFRLVYAFRLHTGLLRRQMPMGEWGSYRAERSAGQETRALFPPVHLHRAQVQASSPNEDEAPWDLHPAVSEADRLLSGEIKYFSRQFIRTSFPPDWHKDPLSGIELDSTRHWSEYSDDIETDIKFIWEPNRFLFVYTLARAYAATQDEKYPEAFWTLIEDWAKNNPPNTGPNWMDGQEISLRLIAWIFGYHAFLDSPSSSPERLDQFKLYVAAQTERIYRNRSFAVFTHNNHSITEAFAMWMVGLLFPGLKNAKKYLSFGHRSLEREAGEQIFPDGTYSMYSLNYHRFVLHIYLYTLRLAEINHFSLSAHIKRSVNASLEHLSQLIEPQTGQMPVYGSNDGALVLPLNNCDFTDYRPLLQLGWYITKGERLFEPGPWDEDIFWLYGTESPPPFRREGGLPSSGGRRAGDEGKNSFPHGGICLLRSTDSRAIIRCTDFASRPSHADQLHVDLWMHGHNIAIDAGTYLYSGESVWRNGLARTSVHNTVAVDNKDQMALLSRFTWTNWSKGIVLRHEKDLWQGEHNGYKPVSHERTVMALEGDRWLVIDNLFAKESHHYALQWLLGDYPFEQRDKSVLFSLDGVKYVVQAGMTEGGGNFSLVRADPNSTRGWRSRYYGHKEPAISLVLETNQPQVTFWTFFGVEDDTVELKGDVLRVNDTEINLKTIDDRP